MTNMCMVEVTAKWKALGVNGHMWTYTQTFEPLRINPAYKKKDKCNGWTCHADPNRKPYFTDDKVWTWLDAHGGPAEVYACAAPAMPQPLGDEFSCVVPNGYHPELGK
jgi:hypothetical protein